MITVQETTIWNTHFTMPNHKYILSDDMTKCYAYIKHGETKPYIFNKPGLFDKRYRTFKVLIRTQDPVVEKDTWKVTGSKGDIYKVALRDGGYTCTCPAATFRHQECKHIQQIKNG